jgi:hypothetical protein
MLKSKKLNEEFENIMYEIELIRNEVKEKEDKIQKELNRVWVTHKEDWEKSEFEKEREYWWNKFLEPHKEFLDKQKILITRLFEVLDKQNEILRIERKE